MRVIDENRDYHAELLAFYKQVNAKQKQENKPPLRYNKKRYIQGKIDYEDGRPVHMVLAPIPNSPEHSLLSTYWWNKFTIGLEDEE